MIQIIKRKEGEKSEKSTIEGQEAQVSLNSWGHLAIRIIRSEEEDVLAVLDQKTTNEVFRFYRQIYNLSDKLPF